MMWRVAPCLNVLLSELNAMFPHRDKTSDGSIGNAEHSARSSDHNPDERDIVHARDFDNDTRGSKDMHTTLREGPIKRQDRRIKYCITRGKIISYYPVGSYDPWAERPYHGTNPHDKHGHVSARSGMSFENDLTSWFTGEGGETYMPLTEAEEQDLRDRLTRIERALFKGQSKDPVTGKPRPPLEHLNVIQDMLSEVINTQGELADAIKKLADQH